MLARLSLLMAILFLVGCMADDEGMPVAAPQPSQLTVPLVDFPPAAAPYPLLGGQLWLVHTTDGQLMAFAPESPEYVEDIDIAECRFAWNAPTNRFVDPCSGDEWELDGRLNLEHSTERWSSDDLDQYDTRVEDGLVHIDLSRKLPGSKRAATPTR